ncbi:sugar porter family MFS transporter [Angustibacter luteus]|uniref:Sugar porter family MFS transporter n=1 Tax=Angustibacter luteus TaxID=658456 RepID=A0ABW1JC50_9ACTN
MSDVTGDSSPAPQLSEHHGKVVMLSIAAAMGGFLFGFDSSVINGAVDAVEDNFELSSFVTGFVVAIALLGCAAGAWYAGRWADKWGRTRVMLIGAILFFVSSLGAGFAFSVWDLAFWRLVGGLGIGIASVIAPAYIAEIAPASMRGRLGSLQQLAITIGIFVALLSDAFWANTAGGANDVIFGLQAWRWMFIVGVVPSAVYGILALQIPESPRYLVATGELKKATEVLRRWVGMRAPEKKVEEIQKTIDREHTPSTKDLRGNTFGLMPIVWVGIALSAFQQLVGINVIFYYSTTLWQAVGFSESNSFVISVITSVTNVAVTVIAILLVDKIGRRILLLVGSVGMAVSLGAMTLAFTQAVMTTASDGTQTPQLGSPWNGIALVGANLFVVSFGATWGPVVWVLLGEMFPNRIRGAALSVAAAAQWLTNFVVTTTFPPLSSVSLVLAYGLYTGFAVLSFFFVLWKISETKGIELEDMSGDVRSRRPASAPAQT